MRNAIRGHQRSSAVIRGHQRSSEVIIRVVIRGHQRPSEAAAREESTHRRRPAPAPLHLQRPPLQARAPATGNRRALGTKARSHAAAWVSRRRVGVHASHSAMTPCGARWSRRSCHLMREVISGHQRSSAIISGHQRSSAVISGHQRSSAVISGHQRSRHPHSPSPQGVPAS
jgi:hypothetical protein